MAAFALVRTLAFGLQPLAFVWRSANPRLKYGKNGIEFFRRWRILSGHWFLKNNTSIQ
jgi:hypothetical protein